MISQDVDIIEGPDDDQWAMLQRELGVECSFEEFVNFDNNLASCEVSFILDFLVLNVVKNQSAGDRTVSLYYFFPLAVTFT